MFQPPECSALALRELPPLPEPLAGFDGLRSRAYPWLLDSALRSPRLGRYSFAGADPWLVLRARGGRVELHCRRSVAAGMRPGRRVIDGDFFELARGLLRPPALRRETVLPFVGGAVGYLGYELAEQLEPLGLGGFDDLGLPDAVLLFVDRVVAWDHQQGRRFAAALGFAANGRAAQAAAEETLERWTRELEQAPAPAPRCSVQPATRGDSFACFDEGTYGKAVATVKEEIAAGNVYQACLTQRMERAFSGDPWALYRSLRRINPAPFACYLELPELVLAGSSPERFLRLDADGRAESRPIKGTRARGRHAAEDAARRAQLEASLKDRAENLMIVDLVRNDLGRVCETGSIDVPELMAIESYASVFQMVSTVSGRLRADRDVFDLLRATFPPGSMTGAPKIAAMRLLNRLEPVRRGPYAGAVGYLDARGGADLSVVIRTLFLCGGRACWHAGGGIVADSEPRAEWRESLDKAAPLVAALRENGS